MNKSNSYKFRISNWTANFLLRAPQISLIIFLVLLFYSAFQSWPATSITIEAGVKGGLYDQVIIQPSINLPSELVVNTTGAGDAVAAGILYGVHQGWDLESSARLGICAAATCIMDTHTSDGIKSVNETLNIVESYEFRKI